jgi:hypothetical protein
MMWAQRRRTASTMRKRLVPGLPRRLRAPVQKSEADSFIARLKPLSSPLYNSRSNQL